MAVKKKSLGLALGGGGVRGLSHIGVLRALDNEDIPVDMVVGTSIGALVGAAFASGMEPAEMEKKADDFFNSSAFMELAWKFIKELQNDKRLTLAKKIQGFFKGRLYLAKIMFKSGMLQREDLQSIIEYFLPDIDVQDTQIPFRAVVTDLVSGQSIVIDRGSLRRAVLASCAMPGTVAPVEKDRMLLSDGGIINKVPVTIARDEGAEFVVGVCVSHDICSEETFNSAIDVYIRAAKIVNFHLERARLEKADVVIRPRLQGLRLQNISEAGVLVQAGETAALGHLEAIQKGLAFNRGWPFLGNLIRNFAAAL